MQSIFYGKKMKKVYKEEYAFHRMALRGLRDDERNLRDYKDRIMNPENELKISEEFVESIQLFSKSNDPNIYDESKKVEYNGVEYNIERVVLNPQNKVAKYYLDYKTYIEDEKGKSNIVNSIRNEATEKLYKYAEEKRGIFERLPSSREYRNWIWADEDLKKGQAIEIRDNVTDEKFNAIVSEVNKNCVYLVTYGGFRKYEVRKMTFDYDNRDIKFKVLN